MTQGPGAGWWLARDGRWYPPELHPSVLNGDQTVEQLTGVAATPETQVVADTTPADTQPTQTETVTPPAETGDRRQASEDRREAEREPVEDTPPPTRREARTERALTEDAPPTAPPTAEPDPVAAPDPVADPDPVAEPEPVAAPEPEAAPAALASEPAAEPPAAAPTEPPTEVYIPPAQDPAYEFEVASAPSTPAVTPEERAPTPDPAVQVNQVEGDSSIRATVASTGSDEWDVPPERPGRALLAAVIAAAVILAGIAAYSFLSDGGDGHSIAADEVANDDSVATTAPEASTEPSLALGIGVCINDIDLASREQVSDVVGVDCATEHTHEVYFQYDITEVNDFDLSSVRNEANNGCTAEFAGYIGIDFAQSAYRVLAFHPFRDAWNNGDRTVTCLVYNPLQEVLTGSLQGTAG